MDLRVRIIPKPNIRTKQKCEAGNRANVSEGEDLGVCRERFRKVSPGQQNRVSQNANGDATQHKQHRRARKSEETVSHKRACK